jgi:hypothetical protein
MLNFSTEFLGLGLKFSPSIPTIVESIIDCVVSGLVSLLGVITTEDCRFFEESCGSHKNSMIDLLIHCTEMANRVDQIALSLALNRHKKLQTIYTCF